MSAGPLHWFRKNQKIMLVVFGVLLMIVFTVGSVLDQMFTGQGPDAAAVRTVASTSFGEFTNREMDEFTENNRQVAQFTNTLAQLAGAAEDGTPKARAVPVMPINTTNREIRDREILRRLALAKYAEEKGVYVGDDTLEEYFNRLCNNELGNQGKTAETFNRELERYSWTTIKTHLKTELKTIFAQQLINAGFGMGAATPLEIYHGHDRMRRKAVIEYMHLNVEDFLPQVTAEPSEAEMRELFEEGNDRTPDFPFGPGFKTPRSMDVAFFAADRSAFLKAEEQKITEEAILTKYQEWVENEDPRVVDLSVANSGLPGLPGNDGSFKPDENSKGAPSLDAPKNNSTEPKKEDDSAAPAPGEDVTGKSEPKTEEPAKTEPKKDDAPKKDAGKESGEPEKSDSSNIDVDGKFQFVTFQEKGIEETKQDASKTDEVIKQAGPTQTEPAKQDAKTDPKSEKKVDSDDLAPLDQTKEGTETPKTETETQDPENNDKSEKPGSVPPLDTDPKNQEASKPKIKPLDDEIRKVIRAELAAVPADKAIEESLDAARTKVENYLYDYSDYLAEKDEFPKPDEPNFEKIAETYGLTYEKLDDTNYDQLRRTDFGQTQIRREQGMQGMQLPTTAQNLFGNQFDSGSTQAVFRSAANADDIEYLYWGVDRKPSRKVTFDEAKPKIIEYYQRQKAIELAKEKAKAIAAKVSSENKLLSAEFGDEVIRSKTFGWMEPNRMWETVQRNPQFEQLLGPQEPATMGSVIPDFGDDEKKQEDAKPLEAIDHRFMYEVFKLKQNEIGHALDATREKLYIFQVVNLLEPLQFEKDQFFVRLEFVRASSVSQVNQRQAREKMVIAILDKYKVKWFGERDTEDES